MAKADMQVILPPKPAQISCSSSMPPSPSLSPGKFLSTRLSVLKTSFSIITKLSTLSRLWTRLVPWYRRVGSWKDHVLLVFFLGPFSSAKTFLSLLPSFIFAHRLPTSKVLIAEGGPAEPEKVFRKPLNPS